MDFSHVKDYFEDYSLDEPYTWELRGVVREGVHRYRGWDGVEERLGDESPAEFEGLGTVELIENVGGEGEGDHMHMILGITFPDGTRKLYQKDGYWSSYDGEEIWGGPFFEVRPAQEVVTVYKKVGT